MSEACSCEIPCWSGVWYQTEEEGYLEISDFDERHHAPPPGWELLTVDYNFFNSSQIFRYGVKVAPAQSFDRASGLLAAAGVTGIAIVGLPIVRAILAPWGIVL